MKAINILLLFGLLVFTSVTNAMPAEISTDGAILSPADRDDELEKNMQTENIGSLATPEVDELSNELKQTTTETSDETFGEQENDEYNQQDEVQQNNKLASKSSLDRVFVPLYRYYKGAGVDHFYTTSLHEIGTATPGQLGRHGYRSEGVAGIIMTRQINHFSHVNHFSVPLYRYWNPHIVDHFYTTNFNELHRGRHGWLLEGVQGYCFNRQLPQTRPLYRYWNGIDHFYTVNPHEIGTTTLGHVGRHGYRSEGITCYIY